MKGTGAKLIFATTTPYPAGVKPARKPADAVAYNKNALEIMNSENIKVNDLYTGIKPHLGKLQKKVNVHFTPEGSLFLGRMAAKSILEELKK